MATIPLSNGATGTLTFQNVLIGLDPTRVANVSWSLLSNGNGALTLAGNQLSAHQEGMGRVQAAVSLVNPTESRMYTCYVEATPPPAGGGTTMTSNPIGLTPTFTLPTPTIPPSLHRTQPTKVKTNVTGSLEVRGVRFDSTCKVNFDGSLLTTAMVDAEKLTCTYPASATDKIVLVKVVYGPTGADSTTSVNFEYKG